MISPLWDLVRPKVYIQRLCQDNYCWSLAWIVVGLRPWKGGRAVLSIVSVLSHQTCLTETLIAELEDREIDWMLRKHSQVKRKAVLGTICCVTLMPICMRVEFTPFFVGYSVLCAEIIKDNWHFWRKCLIPRVRRGVESCWNDKETDFSFRRNLVQFRFERVTCVEMISIVDVLVGTWCLRQGGMSVASRGNDRDHWCCLLQGGGRVTLSLW